MSQAAAYTEEGSNDSDVTYCSEIENHSQKRQRKKREFYDSHLDCITKLENLTIQARKNCDPKTKTKVLKKIQQNYKAKNKNVNRKNKKLATEISLEIEPNFNKLSISQKDSHLPNVNLIKSEHAKVEPDASQEMSYDVDMKEILACVNYEPSEDFKENSVTSVKVFTQNTVKITQCRKKYIINSNYNLRSSQDIIFKSEEKLNSIDLTSVPVTAFENFVKDNYPQDNKINLLSDITINDPKQQLLDKCLPLPLKQIPKKTRKCIKRKPRRKFNNPTQKSIITNFFTPDEQKENITQEEKKVFPVEEKNKIPTLTKAVEMMEICKKNLLLRLEARKEEILKLRASQASSKNNASNEITKEELLQNMQFLNKISAQYKKKYKSMGIDLFDD